MHHRTDFVVGKYATHETALADIALDVAIGRNNPRRDALKESIARRPGARAHVAPDTLAPLMARADFAVGAGGTTTWERFCLDLPSVIVALAQNQVQTCESLDATSRIEYAGYWSNLTAIRKVPSPPAEMHRSCPDRLSRCQMVKYWSNTSQNWSNTSPPAEMHRSCPDRPSR